MKRIKYIPGGISLILLVPACLLFMQRQGVFIEYRSLDLIYPRILQPEDTLGLEIISEEPQRSWHELYCDGPLDSVSQRTIAEFRRTAHSICSERDTVHGIRLNLGSRTKWSTVIAAVDAATLDSNSMYWLNDSSIRTFWAPPVHPSPSEHAFFECLLCNDFISMPPPPPSPLERIMRAVKEAWKKTLAYWPIPTLLLALTILSMSRLQRT